MRVCHKCKTHPLFRFFMIFFIMIFLHRMFFHWMFLHRISRMNRKAFLLIGLLTDFRRILAAGQWLAPDICSYCFFVTQISQMTQIFLRGRVLSHRFHRYTQIFYGTSDKSLCSIPGGICNDRTGRLRENP